MSKGGLGLRSADVCGRLQRGKFVAVGVAGNVPREEASDAV